MEKEQQRKCENCIHYIRHFRKDKIRYVLINCGHCMYKFSNGHFRKTDRTCEFYQERDKQQENQKRIISVTECLSLIAERLNELKEILKDERESII